MKKRKYKAKIWGTLVVGSLVASYAWAQSVSDDEILKMLDKKAASEKSDSVVADKAAAQQAAAEKAAAEKAAAQQAAAEKAAAEKAAAQQAAAEKAAAQQAAAEKAAADKAAAQQAAADKAAAEKAAADKAAAQQVAADKAAAEKAAAEKAAADKAAAEKAAAEKAAAQQAAADKAAADKAAANKAAIITPAVVKTKEAVPVEVIDVAKTDDKTVTKEVNSTEGEGSMNEELISITMDKVTLQDAVSLFAQISGANIIVPDLTEASTISVTLKDVEWHSALQSILDTYNYELFQKVAGSNIYSVRRRPDGAPAPQIVETFLLSYATVPNAAKLVKELLPTATVTQFASRNMLVVKSSESSINEIRKVLKIIDIVRRQVFIESKFMELNDGAQKDLGLDWKQLGIAKDGTGGLGVTAGASSINYADGNQDTTAGYGGLISSAPAANVLPQFSQHIFTSVLNVDQFNVVLNALESTRGVNVVSNPKIIVASEEKANISIIRQEPNLKQDRQQAMNDTNDTITYQMDPDMPFFEYGIKLDVTPSIHTASNITLIIKPELTRKFGDKKAGKDLTYPIIDKKTVTTTFNLTSGETAAIGGLTEVTDSVKERKVPLLGSIPYLGRLFSWKQTVSDQTETIIFVTVALADTQDIRLTTGLPEDSELARQRLIRDAATRLRNEQARKYYAEKTDRETKAAFEKMDAKENARLQKIADEKAAADKAVADKAAKQAAAEKAAADKAAKQVAKQAAADKAAAEKAAKKAASQQPKGEKK